MGLCGGCSSPHTDVHGQRALKAEVATRRMVLAYIFKSALSRLVTPSLPTSSDPTTVGSYSRSLAEPSPCDSLHGERFRSQGAAAAAGFAGHIAKLGLGSAEERQQGLLGRENPPRCWQRNGCFEDDVTARKRFKKRCKSSNWEHVTAFSFNASNCMRFFRTMLFLVQSYRFLLLLKVFTQRRSEEKR